MRLIDNLSADPNQVTQIVLPNGSILALNLTYSGTTQRWIFNVNHQDLITNNLNLCTFPNVLRQWKNLINFGMACISNDGGDPAYVDDFISGRISLYILTAEEVEFVETEIIGA